MHRNAWGMVLLSIACLTAVGCATTGDVRYVYQDGQFGVVGLPKNTSQWPTNYRKRAEALMAKHFPQGYEVIRAEEVVEGSRVLTSNGTNSAMFEPGGGGHIINLGKMGRTSSRTQADTVPITECRIFYKRADDGEAVKPGEYANKAEMTPSLYVDPNARARAGLEPKLEVAGAKKDEKGKTEASPTSPGVAPKDAAVGVVGHAIEKP